MSRLAIEGLSLAAGGRNLVTGLSCVVEAGERVAVRGPSGVGKTTLLRAVAGLDDPAAGLVTLDGQPGGVLGWPALRRRVIYVAQVPALFPGSVEVNLRRAFAHAAAADATYARQRAVALLEALGLREPQLAQDARSLSVGEQQRVCLVRALLLAPRFVLLDEPASALDAEATAALEALVRQDGEARGLGALIVTHDDAQAARWCHRTLSLAGEGARG